jgi:murein DD-endopeptidase MepM/ murein hydrolase activator NlpD
VSVSRTFSGKVASKNNHAQRKSDFDRWWVYGLIGILFSGNIAFAITLYLSPDFAATRDAQTAQAISAYETRIATLRAELDRLHSRQYAKAGDINLQLQDLLAQQEQILEQHDFVRSIAKKAKAVGIDIPARPAATKTSALGYAPSSNSNTDIHAIIEDLQMMKEDTISALTALGNEAEKSTSKIVTELSRVGLNPRFEDNAVGGPLLPPAMGDAYADQMQAANFALDALSRYEQAKEQIHTAPIFRPLPNSYGLSSRFGNRRDPFTGRSAFHSGLDFRAPRGAKVSALGIGKVTFAGRKGGYGNAVEITHLNGLVSRYAHLSKIKVKKGQKVDRSTIIGLVGSTGRSTGPHLHLEVRKNDRPTDPAKYINVGNKLRSLI